MPPRHAPRPTPRRDRRGPAPGAVGARARRAVVAAAVALLACGGVAATAWLARDRDRPRRLLDRAEAATGARDWPAALDAWRAFNRSGSASSRSLLAEARAALALDRGLDAGRALERSTRLDPADAGAWRARLDRLRVLDRPTEAIAVGRAAMAAVGPADRPAILALWTLALLAELPGDQARDRLDRWIAADPADLDARAARLARVAADPRPGDPDRASRIAELSAILGRDPGHVAAREALIVALADAGEPDRGRAALDAWPADSRDARYDRLRARWDLDYDRRPDRAADAYRRALAGLPHDGKAHYGLARALRALGRDADARREAAAVARLRERLDPAALGPRLAADLARPGDPRAQADLAALCEGAGLAELAGAWLREASRPAPAIDR